mgnify:CR=1 FL=1
MTSVKERRIHHLNNFKKRKGNRGDNLKAHDEEKNEEEESKNLLLECIDLAQDKDMKELLKSVVVDEEHHIRILEHIRKLVESYSKKIQ